MIRKGFRILHNHPLLGLHMTLNGCHTHHLSRGAKPSHGLGEEAWSDTIWYYMIWLWFKSPPTAPLNIAMKAMGIGNFDMTQCLQQAWHNEQSYNPYLTWNARNVSHHSIAPPGQSSRIPASPRSFVTRHAATKLPNIPRRSSAETNSMKRIEKDQNAHIQCQKLFQHVSSRYSWPFFHALIISPRHSCHSKQHPSKAITTACEVCKPLQSALHKSLDLVAGDFPWGNLWPICRQLSNVAYRGTSFLGVLWREHVPTGTLY